MASSLWSTIPHAARGRTVDRKQGMRSFFMRPGIAPAEPSTTVAISATSLRVARGCRVAATGRGLLLEMVFDADVHLHLGAEDLRGRREGAGGARQGHGGGAELGVRAGAGDLG